MDLLLAEELPEARHDCVSWIHTACRGAEECRRGGGVKTVYNARESVNNVLFRRRRDNLHECCLWSRETTRRRRVLGRRARKMLRNMLRKMLRKIPVLIRFCVLHGPVKIFTRKHIIGMSACMCVFACARGFPLVPDSPFRRTSIFHAWSSNTRARLATHDIYKKNSFTQPHSE